MEKEGTESKVLGHWNRINRQKKNNRRNAEKATEFKTIEDIPQYLL